ncbi:hypothetical protein JCM11251_001881 [Rhodosporidiobolus azoricus]
MTQIYSPALVPPVPKDSKEERLDNAVSLAEELFELPTITGGQFVPGDAAQKGISVVQYTTSSRSLSGLSKRNATQTLILSDTDSTVVASTPPIFGSEEIKGVSLSPDGKRQAVFRLIAAKEGKEARKMIEIVEVASARKETELEVGKGHGEWYFDGTFGPPAWHPSSLALVYTAEAPPPKADPKATRPFREKYHYEPDFGETFTGRREPTLFLLVLPASPLATAVKATRSKGEDKPTLHRLTFPDTVPSTWFGQPVFLPTPEADKAVLAATGYSALGDGRKLGIVYCQNRLARIYALSLEVKVEDVDEEKLNEAQEELTKSFRVAKSTPLSAEDRSSRSPRVVPSSSGATSTQLVYVSNLLGGPHASCGQLHLASLALSTSSSSPAETVEVHLESDKVLVSVVDVPDPKNPGAGTASDPFPGLYVDQLPLEPFLSCSSSTSVVMSSIWRSRRVPLAFDLQTGKATNLAPWPERKDNLDAALPYNYLLKSTAGEAEDPLASFTVLGTDGKDRVLGLRSSPVRVAEVVVGKVAGAGEETKWVVVKKPGLSEKLSTALSSLSYTILPLPKFDPTELILISPIPIDPTAPSSPNLPPLINQPHGGPHSTVCSEWSYGVAALVLAGNRFVHVNYPGSLGFGQAAVDVLPPALGELEVEATLAAPHYLNSLSLASRTKGKNLLMGGSHGGWTACHLTARWPQEYDAVVMRNPVTDIVGMADMTDIPDWCFAEGTLPYSFTSPPSYLTPNTYSKMHQISPLRHAHAVKTPTLLLIGADDRRVPPDQGRAWYHALKKREAGEEVEVEMLKFPGEGHPIANNVEQEWVAWEAGLRWLAKHTDFS